MRDLQLSDLFPGARGHHFATRWDSLAPLEDHFGNVRALSPAIPRLKQMALLALGQTSHASMPYDLRDGSGSTSNVVQNQPTHRGTAGECVNLISALAKI